ncbi:MULTISPECIES: alpha/beta fold hydrolase [unclassified Rhodococcus (in: high G+C Gram-positive bacteria)]|uniref:alpha/beta fold hydrolase n=1 Tax=unclassified Rhodococcus (in: high G+C Gram-positive bacteria) TaxID=192944 RepID=UPI002551012F|nr:MULTISPECIES: alpha/beta hydrolase [unclassified Rhodococcus (in: high G+C Gram-positive bacteria)]
MMLAVDTGTYRTTAGRDAVQEWCRRRLADWSTPHTVRRIDTSLGSTVVTSVVRPDAQRTVVVVPGELSCAALLTPLIDAMPDATVHVADMPGQPGLSSGVRPRRGRASADYGRWLEDTLTQIGGPRPVLLGIGSGAAAALSATCRSSVGAMVLVRPEGIVPVSRPDGRFLRRRTSAHSTSRAVAALCGQHFRPDDDLVEWRLLVSTHCAGTRADRHISERRLAEWSRAVPLEVVAGSCDPVLDHRRLDDQVWEITGRDTTVLDDCGHLPEHECPRALTAAIERVDRLVRT